MFSIRKTEQNGYIKRENIALDISIHENIKRKNTLPNRTILCFPDFYFLEKYFPVLNVFEITVFCIHFSCVLRMSIII